jgi:hypothetical protein
MIFFGTWYIFLLNHITDYVNDFNILDPIASVSSNTNTYQTRGLMLIIKHFYGQLMTPNPLTTSHNVKNGKVSPKKKLGVDAL